MADKSLGGNFDGSQGVGGFLEKSGLNQQRLVKSPLTMEADQMNCDSITSYYEACFQNKL